MKRLQPQQSVAIAVLVLLGLVAPSPGLAHNCNNPNYGPPAGEVFMLCNDPLADGLFTEDGVTGYQYIYDLYMGSGCCGTFMLGGDLGPLGAAGTFNSQASAWYRTGTDPSIQGVWQIWGTAQVTGNGTSSHAANGGVPISTTSPKWSLSDGAAVGNTNTDVWEIDVTHSPVGPSWTGDYFGTPGLPVPWALDNPWHLPSEYGWSSEYYYPGFAYGTQNQDPTKGVAWQTFSGFSGGNVQLQQTIRILSPYEPGSINWYHDRPNYGVVTGPNGAPVPQVTCIVGDANCDGYVDIAGDILVAFSNFTGPGSYGKTRPEGDVHGPGAPTIGNGDGDGDVDVSDILTMFGNFTGPAPDEAGGLAAAEAGDPSTPDLIYDSGTGEVILDVDGSAIIGYVLKNGSGTFVAGNHTTILAGVSTSLPGELSEAAFSSPVGSNSIGLVFPTGMDLSMLTAYLTTNEVSTSLGAPVVPFDLVVIGLHDAGIVPEPSTYLMSAIGLVMMGCIVYRRRRVA